jgi:hypothetical protein
VVCRTNYTYVIRLTDIPTSEVGDEGDPDGPVVNFVNWDGPYNIEACR